MPKTSLSVIGETCAGRPRLARDFVTEFIAITRNKREDHPDFFMSPRKKRGFIVTTGPMMRKVASLTLRIYSESQPRVFLCSLRFSSGVVQQIEAGIAAVASSPIQRVRQWPPSGVARPPFDF